MFTIFLNLLTGLSSVLLAADLSSPLINTSGWKSLAEGDVIVSSVLENQDNQQQKFDYQLSVVHPQNCQRAFGKLSLYEQFQSQMSFVKRSKYSDETNVIDFLFDHPLMPFPITLTFKIPRIKGPGIYDFTFEQGFFKNLAGKVFVTALGTGRPIQTGCLIQVSAFWQGPDIGVSPLIFNAFTTTLSKIGSEKLLRYSRF